MVTVKGNTNNQSPWGSYHPDFKARIVKLPEYSANALKKMSSEQLEIQSNVRLREVT